MINMAWRRAGESVRGKALTISYSFDYSISIL